jgi:hypothetical protein
VQKVEEAAPKEQQAKPAKVEEKTMESIKNEIESQI